MIFWKPDICVPLKKKKPSADLVWHLSVVIGFHSFRSCEGPISFLPCLPLITLLYSLLPVRLLAPSRRPAGVSWRPLRGDQPAASDPERNLPLLLLRQRHVQRQLHRGLPPAQPHHSTATMYVCVLTHARTPTHTYTNAVVIGCPKHLLFRKRVTSRH